MTTQIVPGSIGAIAKQNNQSIAESFLNVDTIIIVDVSGSMSANDSRNGLSRYDVACKELKSLQSSLPGKQAILSFSNHAEFCPGGIPIFQSGSTNMVAALQFAKQADVKGMKFILISDGDPDDRNATLSIAKTFTQKIDTIYVGNETNPQGRDFLMQLSQMSGGQSVTADKAVLLRDKIETLMLSAASS